MKGQVIVREGKAAGLTQRKIRAVEVRTPSLQGMVQTEPGSRSYGTVRIGLEGITELEELCPGTGVGLEALPVPQVIAH